LVNRLSSIYGRARAFEIGSRDGIAKMAWASHGIIPKEGVNIAMKSNAKQKEVLIVDDDEALLFAFRKIFRAEQIKIDSAASVHEAVSLIDKNDYALVISDLFFDETHPQGGLEVIGYTKERRPDCTTAIWTAYTSPEMDERIGALSPNYHLKKPVPSERIRVIMDEIGLIGSD